MKTVAYYAIIDTKQSPGVYNKIKNSMFAAKNLGYDTKLMIFTSTKKGKADYRNSLIRESSIMSPEIKTHIL